MKSREERVRFCDQCNGVIGWYAEFCDACGVRASGSGGRAKDAVTVSDPGTIEKDLFKAHLRLVHRFKERLGDLDRTIGRLEKSLRELESRRVDAAARNALSVHSARFFELEAEWEDLQRAYNSQSESIEEDFLERIEELEVDIELLPEHQAALDLEVKSLLEGLEASENTLHGTGALLNNVSARFKSRVLGFSTSARGTLFLGAFVLVIALAGAFIGVQVLALPAKALILALIPSWIGICALFLNARSKSP